MSARAIVEATDFETWFAGSKVVDSRGHPLRVYHGSNQAFDRFSAKRGGAVTAASSARLGFFFTSDPAVASQYADLAADRVVADAGSHARKVRAAKQKSDRLEMTARHTQRREDWAAAEAAMQEWENLEIDAVRAEPQGHNVRPVFLRIVNPLEMHANSMSPSTGDVVTLMRRAKAEGHDGVIVRSSADSPRERVVSDHFAVFSADQIRDAIGSTRA